MHPAMLLAMLGGLAVVWALAAVGQACAQWSGTAPFATIFRFVFGLAALACGVAALMLAATLRVYQVFTAETLVARVRCEAPGPGSRFRLQYTPVGGLAETYDLAGDQWAIDGEIVKWHPRLVLLGFKTVHKPTRIGGRFSNIYRETAQPPTAFELNGGLDPAWQTLYRLRSYVPGVEAVYGSSAYTFVEPGVEELVYVTTSGYLVKPKP